MKFIKKIILAIFFILIISIVGNAFYEYYRAKKAFKVAQILCNTHFESSESKEARTFFKENRDLFIPALIKVAEDRNQKYGTRSLAIIFIGEERNVKAIKPIGELLFDNDWRIRALTAESLGKIGDKSAIKFLSQAWLKEDIWEVQQEIVIALVKIRDKSVIPNFLKTYKSNDRNTQLLSAIVLYKLSGDNYYFNVIAEAVSGEEYKTRGRLIWTLGKIGGYEMIPLLEKALDDKDSRIRKLVQKYIEEIKIK